MGPTSMAGEIGEISIPADFGVLVSGATPLLRLELRLAKYRIRRRYALWTDAGAIQPSWRA